MVSLVAILIWRLPSWVVLPVFLVFGSLDGVYLTAVLTKVPEGAWFTLLLAFILSSIFIIWRFGKEAQWAAESLDRIPASVLLTSSLSSSSSSSPAENDDNHPSSAAVATGSSSDAAAETARPHSTLRFRDVWGGTPATTVPGLGIFFDKVGDVSVLPVAFAQFLRKFSARPRVLVFFHMRLLPVPSVPLSERYVVTRVTTHAADGSQAAATDRPRLDNCYAVVLRHGYVDDVVHPRMGADLVAQIEAAITRSSSNNSTAATANSAGPSASFPLANAQELATLRVACSEQTVYVLGKEAMRIREAGPPGKGTGNQRASIGTRIAGWPRRLVLAMFLWIRENSRTKLADLDIDVDKLIEVGFVKEI